MTDQIGQKRGWLGWAFDNVSAILVIVGVIAFVGKPHAEGFIVDTVSEKVTKAMDARLKETEINQTKILSDQATIKADQQAIKKQNEEILFFLQKAYPTITPE